MIASPVVTQSKFPLLPKDPPRRRLVRPRQKNHAGRGKFGVSDSLKRRAYWLIQQEIGDRNRRMERANRKAEG